jgi:signal peptidase I
LSGREKPLYRVIGEPLLIAIVFALAVRSVVRVYAVPSASMSPALLPGDRIVVTRYLSDSPARGDVVVFRQPGADSVTVKRVIALPGDLVDTASGRVRIGGKPLPEPYASVTAEIPAQIVPADHVFVLGDNRAESLDSRAWGPLPERLILGRARLVLWRAGSTRRVFQWVE